MICKHFLPVYSIYFQPPNKVFHRAKQFHIKEFQFIFLFVDHAFGIKFMNSLSTPRSQRFHPIFFSNSFVIKSMIYFEWIFLSAVKMSRRLIFQATHVLVLEHHLLKRVSCLHWIAHAPLPNWEEFQKKSTGSGDVVWGSFKIMNTGAFPCGLVKTNLTSIHEDTGSILSFSQWVKDPGLPLAVV